MPYPILGKPRQFTKPRDQWSRSECREVLAWLLGLIEPRTDRLLERLGLAWTSRPTGWLGRVESAVPAQVWTHEFWEASRGPETVVLRGHTFEQDLGPRLAASGEALGADLGLLLARSFAEELNDDARWVVGSHGRTYVSNNLPVLKGRGKAEYDPLLIGLNLAARLLPDYEATAHVLGMSDLHDHGLRQLSDPAWGTKRG